MQQKLLRSVNLLIMSIGVIMFLGLPNNPRYGSDAPRLRQSSDGPTDSEQEAGTGRQRQRNGNLCRFQFTSASVRIT